MKDNLMLNAIILVDHNSRSYANIDIPDLDSFGVDIISDLSEIFSIDYISKPVILLEGFVGQSDSITDVALYKLLLNIDFIFIGNDDILIKQIQNYARIFCLDTSLISYGLIASVVNGDSEAQEVFPATPIEKSINVAKSFKNDPNIYPEIRELANNYLSLSTEFNKKIMDIQQLQEELSMEKGLLESKNNQVTMLSNIVHDTFRQTVEVNEKLKQYSFICSPSIYTKVSLKDYKRAPNVLYLKEQEEFLHLDSLIYTLAESLKTQYAKSVKVLYILDNHAPQRVKKIPSYYTIFADGVFSKPHIHISDYMCTTGAYAEILRIICTNLTNVDILLVVDCKLANDTVIPVREVVKYDLCRSLSGISRYTLSDTRTIVNNQGSERDLTWDYLDSYRSLNNADRFLNLSGRPVIREIIRTIKHEFGF